MTQLPKAFVHPKPEELIDSGAYPVISAPLHDLHTDTDIAHPEHQSILSEESFEKGRVRWNLLATLELDELLDILHQELDVSVKERREILLEWLARDLGMRRRTTTSPHRRRQILWSLIDTKRFDALSPQATEALWMLAKLTPEHRATLHPVAATAAIVLWRHHTKDAHHLVACVHTILAERALPDDPSWLYTLVTQLKKHTNAQDTRNLLALTQLQLTQQFWNVAALLAGMTLVHTYAPWRHLAHATPPLVRACDCAAEEHPHKARPWIEIMASATLGGQLDHTWLERIMQACIRLNLDEPEREAKLRAYHDTCPYEADHRRLLHLYKARLEIARRLGAKDTELFTREGIRLATLNPMRAQRLLELALIKDGGKKRRTGSITKHLSEALDALRPQDAQRTAVKTLLSLMVHNCAIEPHAAGAVRRLRHCNVFDPVLAPSERVDLYLVVSNYERAFQHLTCKYDGVDMTQADKHAASRVKYFVEKRVAPGSISRVVETAFAPVEWLGSNIASIGLMHRAVTQGMRVFEKRTRLLDLSKEIVSDFATHGHAIHSFEEIANLDLDSIERILNERRSKRILLGAIAGGLSGGLAPLSWGIVSMTDVPVLLGLCADICSRFCWYYGFDPRAHQDLPMHILAVALGGARPDAIEPMLLRQNLREFLVRKSFVVGALTQGTVKQVAQRALGRFFEQKLGPKLTQQATSYAKQAVSRNLQRRAAELSMPSRTVPLLSAVLGASMNVALVYDICEAAQAVLTDRFLERKYPDWIRQFEAHAHDTHTPHSE